MRTPGETWRKSTYSSPDEDCVEVAFASEVGVRDSKNPAAGHLRLTPRAWHAFLTTCRDLPAPQG
ncbi:protein of unknown function [Amycolatopsis arida]|uniref:DUF397 domain-containing protein n=1 Tax=Amycolatopsis arida TaxID=587909 RepID=A0A1I5Z2U8_9PSEU|nr:DUF397 domain-containing protein [Amycolatopsis arida]TDX90050.1 uncharacterized protein DUF397 [Amycolatopsis arida]SFQ50437.1 protein of unknown function [Amycolatopsis arida]